MDSIMFILACIGFVAITAYVFKPIADCIIFGVMYTAFCFIVADEKWKNPRDTIKWFIKKPFVMAWEFAIGRYGYNTEISTREWVFKCPYSIKRIKFNRA